MEKVKVEGLNLSFGKKQVLKNVHFSVPENKIVALIGPSGCGKSTLLRSINRMHDLEPTAKVTGSITFEGKNIYDKEISPEEIRSKIGMVFQKPNPFPKSIYDNIAYGLKLHGESDKSVIEKKVKESLKSCALYEEVADKINQSALALSGGQQQRLCIARSIVVEPEVLLMDEPCSALDPISTSKIEELMLKLKERFTIVIVTHSMQQARRVSDYTAFMYLGELIEFGETAQVFDNPKEELTAKYIGGSFG